jgi:uncharacterized membrane protein YfcA
MIAELSPTDWTMIIVGAALIGLGKGGLTGVGNLSIALFAFTFPAAQSVGILLPVLLCADIVAIIIYRQHALWPYIWRLLPWTCGGLFVGGLLLIYVNDAVLRIVIGGLLLMLTGLHFVRQHLQKELIEGHDPLPHSRTFVGVTGILGGFATMAANAAGPVAAIYLLAARLPKYAFLGTMAWFFFIVNMIKIPLQVSIGIITSETIGLSLLLGLVAAAAVVLGRFVVTYIPQKAFEMLVWTFVILAGIRLVIP